MDRQRAGELPEGQAVKPGDVEFAYFLGVLVGIAIALIVVGMLLAWSGR